MSEYYWALEIASHRDGAILHSIVLDIDWALVRNPYAVVNGFVRELQVSGWFPVPDPWESYGVKWVKLDDTGDAMLYRVNMKNPTEYEEFPEVIGCLVLQLWQQRGIIDTNRLEVAMEHLKEYNDPLWGDEDEY